ncbi:hypothetical protein Q7P36_001406 [Cladosporium allicinum]
MTTIRRFAYNAAVLNDRTGLDAVFRATRTTLNPHFTPEPTATIASFIYAHMYAVILPKSSFVLETGSGEIAGYILGTPSTPEFVRRFRACTHWCLTNLGGHGIMAPPNYKALGMAEPLPQDDFAAYLLNAAVRYPQFLFGVAIRELWKKWPAHFQLSILPEFWRQGWGKAMVEVFVGVLVQAKCPGVHAAVEAGNADAEGFLKALGFERYPWILDGGVSGELGRSGGANAMICFVLTLGEGPQPPQQTGRRVFLI